MFVHNHTVLAATTVWHDTADVSGRLPTFDDWVAMGLCECRHMTIRTRNGSGARATQIYMLTHAVSRRLFPGEDGGGGMAAEAVALRERIVKVKRSRLELVTLWHDAIAAADEATHRQSQSQRRTVDIEAKKLKDIARAHEFAE
jgi:hypothetical protein